MNRKRISKPIHIYDTFDRVGVEIPHLPHIARLVVAPMKVIYINQCAAPAANIDRLFTDIEDFTDFCELYWIELP